MTLFLNITEAARVAFCAVTVVIYGVLTHVSFGSFQRIIQVISLRFCGQNQVFGSTYPIGSWRWYYFTSSISEKITSSQLGIADVWLLTTYFFVAIIQLAQILPLTPAIDKALLIFRSFIQFIRIESQAYCGGSGGVGLRQVSQVESKGLFLSFPSDIMVHSSDFSRKVRKNPGHRCSLLLSIRPYPCNGHYPCLAENCFSRLATFCPRPTQVGENEGEWARENGKRGERSLTFTSFITFQIVCLIAFLAEAGYVAFLLLPICDITYFVSSTTGLPLLFPDRFRQRET